MDPKPIVCVSRVGAICLWICGFVSVCALFFYFLGLCLSSLCVWGVLCVCVCVCVFMLVCPSAVTSSGVMFVPH